MENELRLRLQRRHCSMSQQCRENFCIICYVVPSMFMTANPSSSKLYVNLYVSFMTHGSHEMPWNVISMFPGRRSTCDGYSAPERKSQSLTRVCRARFDTLHVNQAPVFLCPCVKWQADGSRQRFACKAAYPPSIARGPSGVTEWRFLVALCPLSA